LLVKINRKRSRASFRFSEIAEDHPKIAEDIPILSHFVQIILDILGGPRVLPPA